MGMNLHNNYDLHDFNVSFQLLSAVFYYVWRTDRSIVVTL